MLIDAMSKRIDISNRKFNTEEFVADFNNKKLSHRFASFIDKNGAPEGVDVNNSDVKKILTRAKKKANKLKTNSWEPSHASVTHLEHEWTKSKKQREYDKLWGRPHKIKNKGDYKRIFDLCEELVEYNFIEKPKKYPCVGILFEPPSDSSAAAINYAYKEDFDA